MIIEDVFKSLDNNNYIAALALALTIPDVCGQVAYPESTDKKGKRLVGKQYETWFEENIGKFEKSPLDENDMPYLSGDVCYALRCAVLHSGNTDIKEEYRKFTLNNFTFVIQEKNESDIYVDKSGVTTNHDLKGIQSTKTDMRINVRNLCNKLCWTAENFYSKNKQLFDNMPKFNLLDWDKEVEKYEKYYK